MSSFTGETKMASSTSPSILLQPELISNAFKELHGITIREFTGGTKNLWLQIYSYLQPSYYTRINMKCSCRLFKDVEKMITFNPDCSPLKPIPLYTLFPHPKYATLDELINRLNELPRDGSITLPSMLLIANGVHDEKGESVYIRIPISIVGESKEGVQIIGGLIMNGKKEDVVNVSDLTLRESKFSGVRCGYDEVDLLDDEKWDNEGSSVHLDNVSVENSGWSGIEVWSTKRSTMKNCNVSHSEYSGLLVGGGGLMTIDGNGTTIHHNCTDGISCHYGLDTYDSSDSIHLASSLTIETISKNNGGGGNYGGKGTIAIVDNEGTIIDTIQEATESDSDDDLEDDY